MSSNSLSYDSSQNSQKEMTAEDVRNRVYKYLKQTKGVVTFTKKNASTNIPLGYVYQNANDSIKMPNFSLSQYIRRDELNIAQSMNANFAKKLTMIRDPILANEEEKRQERILAAMKRIEEHTMKEEKQNRICDNEEFMF